MTKGTITLVIGCISLVGMLFISATASEIGGCMEAVVNNGGAISGDSTPTSTSLYLGESTFTRDFTDGEAQEFAALFANEDGTLGMAQAARSSKPNTRDPTKSYALLSFTAPDSPMNIQLLQGTVPGTIDSSEFTTSITNAINTWNQEGTGHGKTFFGTVTDASIDTPATLSDGIFVHSFQKSTGSWLAGNWLTWDTDPESENYMKLTDSDVIYNTKYIFDTTGTMYSYSRKNPVMIADLTAIALHELGHNVGLDDIYNKPILSWDMSEVMNSYVWGQPRFSLGEGDKAGVAAKYPSPS